MNIIKTLFFSILVTGCWFRTSPMEKEKEFEQQGPPRVKFKGEELSKLVMKAIQDGDVALLKQLLAKVGAVLAIRDKNGRTLLHAAIYAEQPEILQDLLRLFREQNPGASLSLIVDTNGNNLYHDAAYMNDVNALHILGRDTEAVNARNSNDQSPLDLALTSRKTDGKSKKQMLLLPQFAVLYALLNAGANPGSRDSLGRTPIIRAVQEVSNQQNYRVRPKQDDTLGRFLATIQHSFPLAINEHDFHARTPLHYASSGNKENAYIVNELINNGAYVNVKDNQGLTPLHEAVRRNYISTVNTLMGLGADFNAQDGQGRTPLHYAVLYNQPGMIETLLAAGASAYPLDNSLRTPWDYARQLDLLSERRIRELLAVREPVHHPQLVIPQPIRPCGSYTS